MKTTLPAFTFVFWLSITGLGAQNVKQPAYVKGELIVHLKEDMADHSQFDLTRGTGAHFGVAQAIKNQRLRFVLDSLGIRGMRKVVRNSIYSQRFSTARSGESIPIPDFHNLMYLSVDESTDIPALCSALNRMEGILYAEPNYLMYLDALDPDDPFYFLQDGLEQSNDVDIDMERAWDFTTGSNIVRVGVIDTGIDYDHPDLGGEFG